LTTYPTFAGFDSGLTPGLAVIRRLPNAYELVFHKKIKTDTTARLIERIRQIHAVLGPALREYMPVFFAIEEQMGVQVGKRRQHVEGGEAAMNANNAKTVGTQFLAAECALCYGIACDFFQPRSAKVALLGKGGGKAEKKDIQARVLLLTGLKVNQDEADATALAILASQRSRFLRTG